MEHRLLGRSGLKVPVLCLGTATFGGKGEFFGAFGTAGLAEVKRMVGMCLDAGLTMFDTSEIHSYGEADEMLAEAIEGRRDEVLLCTKATSHAGPGPNDVGSSRYHLTRTVEGHLRRLKTDRIDILLMHAFDAMTPVEETLQTLDDLVRAGKVLYIGCSNYVGWQIMKALGISDRYGWPRFVVHQAYYSLVGREYEWELMTLGLDQGVAAMPYSPLGWARLTGKIRRGRPLPEVSRLHVTTGPIVDDEDLYRVVDVCDEIAEETGRTIPQIAINWLLTRPTVASVVIGARNEEQLRDNIGAVGWTLTPDQIERLDAASEQRVPYPYWYQRSFSRSPHPTLRGVELMGQRLGRESERR